MDDVKKEAKKLKQRERKKKLKEAKRALNAKLVQVVPLDDQTGHFKEPTIKTIASEEAETFLREHFWGSRLERTRTDTFVSERKTGPAVPFVVGNRGSLKIKT